MRQPSIVPRNTGRRVDLNPDSAASPRVDARNGDNPPIGLLLAAGQSSRLRDSNDRPKQLMPWPPVRVDGGAVANADGPRVAEAVPMVVAAFDVIRRVASPVIVVLGHRADDVQAAIEKHRPAERGAIRFVVSDGKQPMTASVAAGLSAAAMSGADAGASVLLHLADLPGTRPSTVDRLLQEAHGMDIIMMPEYAGRGGHPVLIPTGLRDRVHAAALADSPGGLRQWWIDHPSLVRRIPVDDAGCIRDVDSMDDYESSREGPRDA